MNYRVVCNILGKVLLAEVILLLLPLTAALWYHESALPFLWTMLPLLLLGGGLSFQMVRRATGVDIVDLSIQSFLGETLSLEGKFDKCKKLATLLLYMEPGVFGEVTGLDTLLSDGTVDYAAVLKKRGAAVGADRTSSNRALTLIVSAETDEELEQKTQKALDAIDILDIDGVSRIAR